MGLKVKQIPTGKWKENCFIASNAQGQALIIDPGAEFDDIVGYIERNGLEVCAILNTHAHYDHVGVVSALKERFQVPFFLHSKDKKLLKSANLYCTLFDGTSPIKIPKVDYYFDEVNVKDFVTQFSMEVSHTPGHTWGSVCIFVGGYLFTGDILLYGKIGPTDIPGGNQEAIFESLKHIARFPMKTLICPGHGKIISLEDELKINKDFAEAVGWE